MKNQDKIKMLEDILAEHKNDSDSEIVENILELMEEPKNNRPFIPEIGEPYCVVSRPGVCQYVRCWRMCQGRLS